MRTIYQPTGRARKKSITPHGYVLVYVPNHPSAFRNGYWYEHRLVAESMVGRRLTRRDLVHHRNGVKTDNRPENLEVLPSVAAHKVIHRRKGMWRRLPGEPNNEVFCACGCGRKFKRFDESGRPRKFSRKCSWRKGVKGGWPRHVAVLPEGNRKEYLAKKENRHA